MRSVGRSRATDLRHSSLAIRHSISLRNLQRAVPLDLPWLRRFAAVAYEECARHSDDGQFALTRLEEINIAIVSDRRIAEIHVQFMNVPGATDVITFDHGDVVISAETARAYAAEHGTTLLHEVGLYIVHAFLHLNGFDDLEAKARRRMHTLQARLLRTCVARLSRE